MICASCQEETSTEPCAACGQGPLLDGRYRLDGVLGRGGSGTTWLATRDGVEVAVKELLLAHSADPKARELIQREARVLRELEHPGIPRWIEAFETGQGRSRALCIVQELIRGRTLAEEAKTRRYAQLDVLGIAEELLRILAWLHALSPPVIHRDIKPANVMRRDEGGFALIDFGAVRDALKGDLGGSTVAGTFGFMAPEQFAGDADARTDLYGLGATMVALLTREPPHTLLDHANRMRWEAHANVHAEVASYVNALVAPDAADRPASAARALARLTEVRAAVAAAPAPSELPPRGFGATVADAKAVAADADLPKAVAAERVPAGATPEAVPAKALPADAAAEGVAGAGVPAGAIPAKAVPSKRAPASAGAEAALALRSVAVRSRAGSLTRLVGALARWPSRWRPTKTAVPAAVRRGASWLLLALAGLFGLIGYLASAW